MDFLIRHFFLRAPAWRCHVEPSTHSLASIGHSGFFSSEVCPAQFWHEISDWLIEAADGRAWQFQFRHLPGTKQVTCKQPLHEVMHGRGRAKMIDNRQRATA